ncbi:MAG: hypothetical protein ABIV13_04985 [Fimbriimonadales bacterium]
MLTVYILSAIVGGILVAASAFMGGDHDTHFGDASFDDIEGDAGIHSDLYLPFLSLRFWTYFITCFGVTGLLLTMMTATNPVTITVVAVVTGLIAGVGTHVLMSRMKDRDTDAGVTTEHLIGREARVLVGVSPDNEGKIRIEVKGELVDITAFTEEGVPLVPGDRALVISIERGRANVVSYSAMLEESS